MSVLATPGTRLGLMMLGALGLAGAGAVAAPTLYLPTLMTLSTHAATASVSGTTKTVIILNGQ